MSRPWPGEPAASVAAYLDAWNEGDTERICDAYQAAAPIYQAGAVQANRSEESRRVRSRLRRARVR